MSYEHKIIVVRRSEYMTPIGGRLVNAEKIADFYCSRMPEDFYALFMQRGALIDFDFYDMNDEPTRIDHYGEHCKMLELSTVIDCLKAIRARGDDWSDYRRIQPLLNLLEGFNIDQWNENGNKCNAHLYAVNYGY